MRDFKISKKHMLYIYQSKLDKACFVHDAAYANSKDLAKRTISVKVLRHKAYETARTVLDGLLK